MPSSKKAMTGIEAVLLISTLLIVSVSGAMILEQANLTGLASLQDISPDNYSIPAEPASNTAPYWHGENEFSISPDESASIDLVQYFIDNENDELTYLATQAEGIAVELSGSILTASAEAGFEGTASITAYASDSEFTTGQEIVFAAGDALLESENDEALNDENAQQNETLHDEISEEPAAEEPLFEVQELPETQPEQQYSAQATTIASCPYTISSSGDYDLSADLSTTGTCITISIANVSLDCKGYKLRGDYSGTDYGIYSTTSTADNITIKNCMIANFSTGIYANSATQDTWYIYNNSIKRMIQHGIYTVGDKFYIENNTINNTGLSLSYYGIYFGGTNAAYRSRIINNSLSSVGTGIYVRGSYHQIERNKIKTFAVKGINMDGTYGADRSNITSNFVENGPSSNVGIYVYPNADYNRIINNTVKNVGIGIQAYSSYSQIHNNTVYNISSSYGLIIDGDRNNITSNKIEKTTSGIGTKWGIYLSGASDYLRIINNTIKNFNDGIYNYGSYNQIHNNRIYNISNLYGLHVYPGSRNNITGNIIDGMTGTGAAYGIYLSSSNYNRLINNTAQKLKKFGLGIIGSSHTYLSNNTIENATFGIDLGDITSSSAVSIFNITTDGQTNRINGKYLYWLSKEQNKVYDFNNISMLACTYCNNITLKETLISNNSHAVIFYNTSNSVIKNINPNGILRGNIIVFNGSNVSIENVNITGNITYSTSYGILAKWVSRLSIKNTSVSKTFYGYYLYDLKDYFTFSESTLKDCISNNQAYDFYMLSSSSKHGLIRNSQFYERASIASGINMTIYNNTFNESDPGENYAHSFEFNGKESKVYNNTFYSLKGRGMSFTDIENTEVFNNTVFKAGDSTADDCIYINAASSNAKIYNNTFKNCGDMGIYLYNSNPAVGVLIQNNTVQNFGTGVSTEANGYGIFISSVNKAKVIGNKIQTGDSCYWIRNSQNIYFSGNNCSSTSRGFTFYGSSTIHSQFNITTNGQTNLINGKYLYWLQKEQNKVYDSSNISMLACIGCKNITVQNLNFANNSHGIIFWKTNDSKIDNITVKKITAHEIDASGMILNSHRVLVNNSIFDNLGVTEKYGIYTSGASSPVQKNITVANSIFKYFSYGIYAPYSDHMIIDNCTFLNQGINGINLVYVQSHNATIKNSFFNSSGQYAVSMTSSNNSLTGNYFEKGGLLLSSTSAKNKIRQNNFNKVTYSIALNLGIGSYNDVSLNNITNAPSTNAVNIYINGGSYNQITNNRINAKGVGSNIIYLASLSNYNLISGNLINDSTNAGIYLEGTNYNNTLFNNTITNCDDDGIYFYGSNAYYKRQNKIIGNIINNSGTDGSGNGIYISGLGTVSPYSYGNNISGNIIQNSDDYGLSISSQYFDNNYIYNNKFNNTNNVYSVSGAVNKWNITKTAGTNIIGGPFIGGNYWDNYTGVDGSPQDGLGSTTYTVASGEIDYLPLVVFMDTNAPTFSNAVNTSIDFRENHNFTANITITNTALDAYIFSTNASGSWVNTSARDISGAQHNASEQENVTVVAGSTVCWYYWANDTSNNNATSSTYCFTVAGSGANANYSNYDGATTDFDNHPTPGNIYNAILEVLGSGRITWPGPVNATNQDFDANINISDNWIFVNTSALHPSFNTSANISLYGLSWADPIIKFSYDNVNFFICNGTTDPSCTPYFWNGSTLNFTVSHFTAFTTAEGTNLTIWDDTDYTAKYPNEKVKFYANYTDAADGSSINGTGVYCEFRENSTGSWSSKVNMTFNATSELYEYNKSFSTGGIFYFNASCFNNLSYANLTLIDSFNITGNSAPSIAQAKANATYTTNYTNEDLFCYANATDSEGDNVSYYGYWYKDGVQQFYESYSSINDGQASTNDEAFAVAVDSEDNILIAGKLGGNLSFAKYYPNSTLAWSKTLKRGSYSEEAKGVAVDSNDNIILTGKRSAGTSLDLWLLKFDKNGNHIWNITNGDSGSLQDFGNAVAIGPGNSIYVAGKKTDTIRSNSEMWILKYDSSGSLLWNKLFTNYNNDTEGMGIAVDSYGNAFAAGYVYVGPGNSLFAVVKYNSSGSQVWNTTFGGSGTESAKSIALDNAGNIYVAGLTGSFGNGSSSYKDVWTVKLNSTGSILWNRTFGGLNLNDEGDGIAVTSDGTSYVSGIADSASGSTAKLLLLRYNSTGSLISAKKRYWYGNERGWGIALNSKDEPVIGGRLLSSSGRSMLMLKYHGFELQNQTEGELALIDTIGSGNTTKGEDWYCSVSASDGAGASGYNSSNIVHIRDYSPAVTNVFVNSTTQYNYSNENITCYANATDIDGDNITYTGFWFKNGVQQFYGWNRTFGRASNDEVAYGIAVDSNSNVIMAGEKDPNQGDLFTVKFDSQGNYLWNVTEDPSGSSGHDVLKDASVDSEDNVVVAGMSTSSSNCERIWVVKYNSSGAKLWNNTLYTGACTTGYLETSAESAAIGPNMIAAAGTIQNSTLRNMLTVVYNSSGSLLWNRTKDFNGNKDDATGVAVDSQGNVFVVGITSAGNNQENPNMTLVKYNSTGAEKWAKMWPKANATGNSIVLDEEGNLIVVGKIFLPGKTRVLAVKFNSSGSEIWNSSYNTSSEEVYGTDAAISPEGSIIISATSGLVLGGGVGGLALSFVETDSDEIGMHDFNVISVYPNGTKIWSSYFGTLQDDFAEGIAVDDEGRIFAAGYTNATDPNYYDLMIYTIYGIRLENNTQGVLANVSTITSNYTTAGDNWSCWISGYDGEVLGDYAMRNNLTVRPNAVGTIGNATILFPTGNIEVNQSQTFVVNATIYCTGDPGGVCTNLGATLDPLQNVANLTGPTDYIQDVYADEDYIYAATDCNSNCDSRIYMWHKNLTYYTMLGQSSNGLQAVYADEKYIYGGGRSRVLHIWNRTDSSTPFAWIYNSSNLGGSIASIISDENYIYASTMWGAISPRIRVFNKTDSQFRNLYNLTGASDFGRRITQDNNSLYVGSMDCTVYIYNKSNFAQSATTLAADAGCDDIMGIDVDDKYIYITGRLSANWEGFMQVFNKTTHSQVFYWNDTNNSYGNPSSYYMGMDIHKGDDYYTYQGGFDDWYTDGWVMQINKTGWSIEDVFDAPFAQVKSVYCDSDWLYAATQYNWTNGTVMIFNNSCGGAQALPNPITISPINITPSDIGKNTTINCIANVTSATTSISYVNFTIILPNSTQVSLGNGTKTGTIWNSSSYKIPTIGSYTCKVDAGDNASNTKTATKQFDAGDPGVVPMNSGTPFYTTSQNPTNGTYVSCLASMNVGESCNVSWVVNATGEIGTSWKMFAYFTGSYAETPSFNVTITGGAFANTAPAISTVFVNSTTIQNYTNESITCWVNSTDADADNVSYNGYWLKNGAQNLTFNTSPANYTPSMLVNVSTLNSSFTLPGEKWACRLRAYDGTAQGAYSTSQNITIRQLPDLNAPVFSNAANYSVDFRRNHNFTANITITNNALDAYIFSTNASGSWVNTSARSISGAQHNASESANVTAAAGSVVCWYYWANDTSNNNATSSTYCFTVQITPDTTAPVFSNAINYSAGFRQAQNFTANITIDNLALDSYIFSTNASGNWTNKTASISGAQYNASETSFINLSKGRSVCWHYWANDTSGNSNTSSTYCFIVQNTAPSMLDAYARPLGPGPRNIITCYARAEDFDNDTVRYEGNWYKNGAVNKSFNTSPTYYLSNATVNVSVLDSSYTLEGENWSCKARAYDGTDYSAYLQSSNLTILKDSNLSIWDETDAKAGSQTRYLGDTVLFWANYTNGTVQIAGQCSIFFNSSSGSLMSFNSTSGLHEYSRTFNLSAVHDWNVSCSNSTYAWQQANDTVNIALINLTAYVLMKVQFWTGSAWVDDYLVNYTGPDNINLSADGRVDIDDYWTPWNTSLNTHGAGTYRAYVALVDDNNITLVSRNGVLLEDSYNFTIAEAPEPSSGGGGGGGVPCEHECDNPGERYCLGGNVALCGSFDNDYCRDIGIVDECEFIEECIEGECVCIENWWCDAWGYCNSSGTQTRQCMDMHTCGTENSLPLLERSCEYIPTCYDNILNQGEEGVDCGGPCIKCPEVEKPGMVITLARKVIDWIGLAVPILIYLMVIASFMVSGYYSYHKLVREEWVSYKVLAWALSLSGIAAVLAAVFLIAFGTYLPVVAGGVAFIAVYLACLEWYAKSSGLNMRLEMYRAHASIVKATGQLESMNYRMGIAYKIMSLARNFAGKLKRTFSLGMLRNLRSIKRSAEQMGEISESASKAKLDDLRSKLKELEHLYRIKK